MDTMAGPLSTPINDVCCLPGVVTLRLYTTGLLYQRIALGIDFICQGYVRDVMQLRVSRNSLCRPRYDNDGLGAIARQTDQKSG